MLKLKNVYFSYGNNKILEDFSLTVKDGECICLFGKSGTGKTTVMRLLSGLEVPEKGNIFAPEKVSCVFQEDRLIGSLTLRTNLRLVLKKQKYEYALELALKLGIFDALDLKADSLSGGMKRRAEIIKAIAYAGDALILDEAFNGIDAENKLKAAEIIKSDYINKGKPVLMITHIKEDAELLNAQIFNFDQAKEEIPIIV